MKQNKSNTAKRTRRHAKIRAKIFGTASMPRLSVFKSNKHISVQVIDDESAKTLAASHSRDAKGKTLLEKAASLGLDIAEKAKANKITKVVFDRGGFRYTGAVKVVADSARKGGLIF